MKPRDYAALTWLIDMRGILEPDLGWLLARLEGRSEPITEGGARQVVRRWQAAGLAEAHRVLVGEPRLITATTKAAQLVGVARVGTDGRPQPLVVPAWTQMKLVAECSRVRLAVEAELGDQLVEWVSDRELRAKEAARQMGSKSSVGRSHQPDARLVLADESRVAVEVELSPKTPAVLDKIIDSVGHSILWDRVRYFATPEASRAVESAVARVKPRKNVITIEPLPQNPVLSGLGALEATVTTYKPSDQRER